MTFEDDDGNILNYDGDFGMTKQAVSIFSGQVRGDVSLNFQVPNNSVNCAVLGYNGPLMTSQVAFTKQAFTRKKNGNPLDRGYIVIQAEDGPLLNLFYISGNSNWIGQMKGLITDLNWDSYAQLMTAANVITRSSATDGIIFPMVDWTCGLNRGYNHFYMTRNNPLIDHGGGYVAPSTEPYRVTDQSGVRDIGYWDFYPCVYLSSVMKESFQQNGLKLAGTVLNDPTYKSMIMTPVNGKMLRLPFQQVTVEGSAQTIPAFSPAIKYTNFNTETNDPENLFSNSRYTANRHTGLLITVTIASTVGTETFNILPYKNGVQLDDIEMDGYTPQVFVFRVFAFAPGDYLEIYVTNVDESLPCDITLNIKIETPTVITPEDYVDPSNFLPKLTCLQMVNFVTNYFGCQTSFDEYSKTVTMNIIEKIKPESAADWSKYYVSHRSQYTVKQAQNNYIRFEDPDEASLLKYNSQHKLGFGEGNIETGNTLNPELDLFKFPFAATETSMDNNGMWLPNIPLVNLKDQGAPLAVASVTDLGGGIARFTMSVLAHTMKVGEIIRLSANGVNLGYFVINSAVNPFIGQIDLYFPFTSVNMTNGLVYRQAIEYVEVKPRILVVKPSTNLSDFSDDLNGVKTWNSSIYIWDETGAKTSYSSIPFATFCKPKTNLPIDTWKGNCALDNPDVSTFVDPTGLQLRFGKIKGFLNGPDIRGQLLIPESIFQSFDFSTFIYLKTEKLTGYFFVDSIVNYHEPSKETEVNLYLYG